MPQTPVNNHLDTQPLATVFTVTVITLPAFAFNLHTIFNDMNLSFWYRTRRFRFNLGAGHLNIICYFIVPVKPNTPNLAFGSLRGKPS